MAEKKKATKVVAEVRPYLEGVANNLADRIWGPHGPAWGTRLSEVEDLVVALREIVSEKLLQQALQRQAAAMADRPADGAACPRCGGSTQPRDPEARLVQTRGGDATWQEPHTYCPQCRIAFFPSVPELGH